MELNPKRGKSNFVFRFFGPGAKAEREYLENVLNNRIQFRLVGGAESSIEAIDIYKHLGSKIGVGSSNKPEIVTRMAVVTTKTFKYRKPILQNEGITIERRISLAQSLMFSSGLYNASVWPTPNAQEMRAIHKPVLAVYRAISGNTYSTKPGYVHIPDVDVIKKLGAPPPLSLVRVARFRLAIRIARSHPTEIVALIIAGRQANRSWLSSLILDLDWAAANDSRLTYFVDKPIAIWWQWLRNFPKEARTILGEVALKAGGDDAVLPARVMRIVPVAQNFVYRCPECGKLEHLKQSMAVHRWKRHGVRCEESFYASGSQCMVCLDEHWTRMRLVQHYQKSHICWHNVKLRQAPLSEQALLDEWSSETAAAAVLTRGGRKRTYGSRKVVAAEGPVIPIAPAFHDNGKMRHSNNVRVLGAIADYRLLHDHG